MNYPVTGDGQIDFAAEQLQLTFGMPAPMPGNMEMVVDGDAAYLNMPFASSAGDDETARWIKTEVDEAATDQMMQSAMSQDPTDVLTALGAVEGEITELGNEEVGGEPTHGYAFDVSADEISPLGGEQAEKLSEVAVAMEAWLDTEGRVRRLSQTVDLAEMMAAMDIDGELPDEMGASLDGITGEQTTVIEFFDLGGRSTSRSPPRTRSTSRLISKRASWRTAPLAAPPAAPRTARRVAPRTASTSRRVANARCLPPMPNPLRTPKAGRPTAGLRQSRPRPRNQRSGRLPRRTPSSRSNPS